MALLATSGVVFLGAHLFYFASATSDDAFISLRYAVNLVAGDGLVFNPGERVEGFSNFLWVMLVAAGVALGGEAVVIAKAFGLVSLGALLFAVFRLVRETGWKPLERAALFFLLGCNWPLAYYSISGLETIFYGASLAGAAVSFVRRGGRIGSDTMALLLAAALTRPEGVIFTGLFVSLHLWGNRSLRGAIVPCVLFAACYGAFLLWRYSYFGAWVPNTYLVKSPLRAGLGAGWVRLFAGGMDEVYAFIAHTGGPIFLALALGGLLSASNRAIAAAGALLTGGLFFEKFAGGDWMGGYRFLAPFVPFYFLLGIEGLRRVADHLTVAPAVRSSLLAGVLALVGIFQLFSSFEFHLQRGRYPYFIMTAEDMAAAGRWIGARYPRETKVVCWRIGALGYYSELQIIDTWGLTDRTIARLRYEDRLTDDALKHYLGLRQPELVLVVGAHHPGTERDGWGMRYRLVRTFPQGSRSQWSLFEKTTEPAATGAPSPGRLHVDPARPR